MTRHAAALFAMSLVSPVAMAVDNGLFFGASIGSAIIQNSRPDSTAVQNVELDSTNAGFKFFAGVRFDSLTLEGGYIDFGKPDVSSATEGARYELSGWDVLATLNLSIGPVDVFGKGGLFLWESATQNGIQNIDASGADPVYGVGLGLRLGSLGFRGEYEFFDVGDVDDVYMLSLGVSYTF